MAARPAPSKRAARLDDAETGAVIELRDALRALTDARRDLTRKEPRSQVQKDRLVAKLATAAHRVVYARRSLDEALSEGL